MADPRYQRFANVLVHYSLGLRPGDRLLIRAAPAALPLLREVYRAAIRAGAHPETQIDLAELTAIKLREGSPEQIGYLSPGRLREIEELDALLFITAADNTRALGGIDRQRLAALRQADQPWNARRMARAVGGELR